MSDFVDCDAGELIPLGNTVEQMKATLDAALVARGFQIIRQRAVPTAWLGNLANLANAFDGDAVTSVRSASVSAPWLVGFQANSAFTPVSLLLQASHSPTYTASPANFSLQYSDNGTDWSTQQSWTSEPQFYAGERRTYPISGAAAHVYWRLSVATKSSGSELGILAIVLEDAAGLSYGAVAASDIIPVSTESIGNATAREFLRVTYSGSAITFLPLMELLVALPMVVRFSGATAGAVTLGITLGGVTVSYTGGSGDSAAKNARKLYEACRDSVNANFTGMDWFYDEGEIFAKQSSPSGNVTASSSNITTSILSHYASPGPMMNGYGVAASLPVDLTSGFLYFIQYNKRGLAWAHKLNTGYYGPIHIGWGNNAQALDYIPEGGSPIAPPLSPIELFVGTNTASATKPDGIVVLSHVWGVPDYTPSLPPDLEYTGSFNYGSFGHPFTKYTQKKSITDAAAAAYLDYLGTRVVTAKSAMLFSGEGTTEDPGLSWPVHRLGVAPQWDRFAINGYNYARVFSPAILDADWYRYTGTLTNEQIVASALSEFNTEIATACSDIDNIIYVTDTGSFPASGYIFIDGEVIAYTSKSTGSFNGCSRAQKATTSMKHYVGDTVLPVGFFIKINYGLIFCGYEEPA